MCKTIYDVFKQQIEFEQPLPSFEEQYPHRLESILQSIAQTYAGEQLFPTVLDTASAYYYKICCGHAFANGNKRLGILFTHIFLLSHDIDFTVSPLQLYMLTEELAKMSQDGVPKDSVELLACKIIEDFTVAKKISI